MAQKVKTNKLREIKTAVMGLTETDTVWTG